MARNRRSIEEKAANRALRQNAPKQARLDAKRKAAKRGYRGEVKASKGASRLSRQAIRSQIRDVDSLGLRGSTENQLMAEYRGMMQGARKMVPFEKAGLKADLRETLAGLDDEQFTLDEEIRREQETIEGNIRDLQQNKIEQARNARENRKQKARNQLERDRKKGGVAQDYSNDVKQGLLDLQQHILDTRKPAPDQIESVFGLEARNAKRDPKIRKMMVLYLTAGGGGMSGNRKAAEEAVRLFIKRRGRRPDSGLRSLPFIP